jgi:hypothetical protein
MPQELAKKSIYGAIRVKDECVLILYSTAIDNIGFQNFTIAHELCHYFLEDHIDKIIGPEGIHLSKANFSPKYKYETEADQFASGLLMPEILCKKLVSEYPDGLDGIKKLSVATMSSLTAAAIRYIDLTTSSSAVVVSVQGKIEYIVRTRDIFKLEPISLKGCMIPDRSLTSKFSIEKKFCYGESEEMETDLSLWIGGTKEIPCIEQVVTLGRTGQVLTVLTCQELNEEEDEDDDDESIDDDDSFNRRYGFSFRQ